MAESLQKVTIDQDDKREGEETRYLVRWKNRQKMAWYSFIGIIFFTVFLWAVIPVWYNYMSVDAQLWTVHITESSEWLYITFGSVIIGYMGSTAYMIGGKSIEVKESDY